MKKISIAITIMLFGFTTFAQNTPNLLNSYLAIKNALVLSDQKTAKAAITEFQKKITAEKTFSQKKDLQIAIDKMANVNSLEKERAAFNEVSTLFWKVVKSADMASTPVYYQYCPMKKAYWLSTEKDIKNPYYGASMLTCGKVVETK
ncbi:MAG: DUF3347 domain-containing protein [Saprospiraceae bacterium]|nr:DUF3347 domain-containing protein [Saprospiraceae bacterium]